MKVSAAPHSSTAKPPKDSVPDGTKLPRTRPTEPGPNTNPHAPHGTTQLARSESVLGSTKEGAHLLSQAKAQHVGITVLSDAQFRARYGNAGGVTTGGHVYVPSSSLNNAQEGALILGHELTHATDGWNNRIRTKTQGYADEARAFYNEGVVARQLGLHEADVQRLVAVSSYIYTKSGAERSRQSIEQYVASNPFYQHAYSKLPN